MRDLRCGAEAGVTGLIRRNSAQARRDDGNRHAVAATGGADRACVAGEGHRITRGTAGCTDREGATRGIGQRARVCTKDDGLRGNCNWKAIAHDAGAPIEGSVSSQILTDKPKIESSTGSICIVE